MSMAEKLTLTEFTDLALKVVESEGKYFVTASALPRGETAISGENVEACGRRILVSQSGYLRIPLGEHYGSESQFSNPWDLVGRPLSLSRPRGLTF